MRGWQEGLVLAHLGQGIAVESSGQVYLCQTRRQLDTVAVGDRVMWIHSAPDQGRIEQILPRSSILARPARNETIKPVAANIDTVYVVLAGAPPCDFLLIDQYLAVCEHWKIKAGLILNKIDLPLTAETEQELGYYRDLGYPLLRVSSHLGIGLGELKLALKNQTSIFTGQSGVGKSSLTNALLPDMALKTNTLSKTSKHGRHTTTAATLYHLPDGGDLIDSPGVAIFGLAGLNEHELAQGYKEFIPFIGQCRFNDCRHANDKDCAVRSAVEQGQISASRYQRFLKLKQKMLP